MDVTFEKLGREDLRAIRRGDVIAYDLLWGAKVQTHYLLVDQVILESKRPGCSSVREDSIRGSGVGPDTALRPGNYENKDFEGFHGFFFSYLLVRNARKVIKH